MTTAVAEERVHKPHTLLHEHLSVDYEPGNRVPRTKFCAIEGLAGNAMVFLFVRNALDEARFSFAVDILLAAVAFIVTWLMLRKLNKPFEALNDTYDARIKHTYPGLLLLIMATLAMVVMFGDYNEFGETLASGVTGIIGLSNVELIMDPVTSPGPGGMDALYHLWAVSIMIQFFVIWPLMITAVARVTRSSMAAILFVSAVFFALSAVQMPLLWDGTNTRRLLFGTDTRGLCMITGSIAAMVRYMYETHVISQIEDGKTRRTVTPASYALWTLSGVAALAVIIYFSFDIQWLLEDRLFQGGYVVVCVAIGWLLLSLASRRNLLSRYFAFSLYVGLGRMGFVLYMVHFPILWFFRKLLPMSPTGWGTTLAAGIMTLVIATIIHVFLLIPGKETPWKISVVVPIVAATVGLLAYWSQPYVSVILDSIPG